MMMNQRRNAILEMLKANGSVRSSTLIRKFGVSDMTIRRDLEYLESEGYLRRMHGGALPVSIAPSVESLFFAREIKNREKKRAIAAQAVKLLEDNSVIYIDSSSTCNELVKILPKNMNLTVFTDSAAALAELRDSIGGITLFLIGGQLANDRNTLDGYMAEDMMQKITVDISFNSCAGFTANGVMNEGLIGTQVKKTTFKNAKKRVLLADSTKSGRRFMYQLCTWSSVDVMITDDAINESDISLITSQGVQIIKATPEYTE
ncbi:MAG TPA: DeoR/GlpR family DNA-binding transcription regulator [Bacillota bacterium]|nr:DeoR/GlpR family DNA-binding transcription regulator [Bacillota bacterium]